MGEPARQCDQQPQIEHRFAVRKQCKQREDQERDQCAIDPEGIGVVQILLIEKHLREQVVPGCRQERHRYRQAWPLQDPAAILARRSFRDGLRRLRPLQQDIKDDGDGGRRSPEVTDPRRRVDLRAQQSVRGKGTGKREHVRDEHQCLEEESRGQDGQGSRPKDGRLNVKQGRGDHVAEKHDGVDHGNERIDLAQANVRVAPTE